MALIDDIMADITSLRSDANTALTALGAFRPSTYTPTALTAPDLADVADVTPATIPTEPTVQTITGFTAGTVDPISTSASSIPAPADIDVTLPTFTLPSFEDTSATVTSPELFGWLEETVQDLVTSGGGNISTAVQDAVFNNGYERILQTQRDALDLTGARTGAKGCRYPNSITAALQYQILTEFTWQRSDLGREITKQTAEMAQRNLQAAMTVGLGIDDAKARLFATVTNASTELSRLATERYKTQIQANLSQFEGSIQTALALVGVQKADREVALASLAAVREQISVEGRINIDQFDAQVRALAQAAESSRTAAEARSRLDLAHFDAEVRAEFMRVETDRMIRELSRSANEQHIRLFSAEVQQQVELQRASIAATQEENKLTVGVLESVAKSYIDIANSMSGQGVAIDITKH